MKSYYIFEQDSDGMMKGPGGGRGMAWGDLICSMCNIYKYIRDIYGRKS